MALPALRPLLSGNVVTTSGVSSCGCGCDALRLGLALMLLLWLLLLLLWLLLLLLLLRCTRRVDSKLLLRCISD